MKGHGSKFGRKKEAAIAALLGEKNQADAARVAGIDLGTLKRWLRLPEFIEEYRRARWEVVEQGYARIQQHTPTAASVLLKLMADPATGATGRIRAALGVFGLAKEALDLDIENTRVGIGTPPWKPPGTSSDSRSRSTFEPGGEDVSSSKGFEDGRAIRGAPGASTFPNQIWKGLTPPAMF